MRIKIIEKCFIHTKMDGFLLYADKRRWDVWASKLIPVSAPPIHLSVERQSKSMKLSSNLHTRDTAQENTHSLTQTTVINKIIFKIETIANDEKDMEHFEASGVTGHDRMWCCSKSSSAMIHMLTTRPPHDYQFHS